MNPPSTLLSAVALSLTALVVYSPIDSLALGIRLGNQDAAAVARGNAFTATADTPGAIYYNPAGISQLEGTQLGVGAYLLSYDVDFAGISGASASSASRIWTLPHLYLTHHLHDTPLTIGLGTYSGFGLGSNWPESSPLRGFTTDTELAYTTVTPVLSWQINPHLSIAGGLTVNHADASFKRGVIGGTFEFEGDDVAPGYHLGLLWDITEQHVIGLTYRSSVNLEMFGQAGLPGVFRGPASGDLTIPRQVVLGYSFRPTPAWNFEADIEWTQWNMFDSLTVNTIIGPITEQLQWKNSVVISLGATRHFANHTWVSAGYWYAEETIPDSTFNPRVGDMNFHVFSIGGGIQINDQLSMALCYQLGYGPDRDVRSSPVFGISADGTYDYLSHAIALTATWRFK